MRWHVFTEKYLGTWPCPWKEGGLTEWMQYVESEKVVEGIMLVALGMMAAAGARVNDFFPPRLSEVQQAYSIAEHEHRRLTPDNRPRRVCWECGGSGYGMGVKNMHGVWVDPRHPAKIKGTLYMTLIPCTCPAYVQDLMNNFPMTVRQALRKYIIAPMGNTNDPNDERCLTTVRDYINECEA